MTPTDSPQFHTVAGRWLDGTAEPDWKVLWTQRTGNPAFPWLIRVRYDALPGMPNPCLWTVPNLDSPRYDLSQAVALPHLVFDQGVDQ
jgi:hypothetical protein